MMPGAPRGVDARARALHAAVLRAAPPLARRPARAEDVGRLAADAVGRVDAELAVGDLVDAGRAEARVERGGRGVDVPADDQVRGDVVARRVARLEDRVDLADRELAVARVVGRRRDALALRRVLLD